MTLTCTNVTLRQKPLRNDRPHPLFKGFVAAALEK